MATPSRGDTQVTDSEEDIHRKVGDYYSRKIREHGATARGVDWNSEESQQLRFDHLLKIVDSAGPFSLNEIGCGYGALVDHLEARGINASYHGIDLSSDMVTAARQRHPAASNAAFAVASKPDQPRDYCVASGIFNVRLETPDGPWLHMILATLETMHESSTRGFAFNALTSYSDAEKMRDYLYYADPLALFDHCKRRFSRQVALLHDYGLYEFTILVRKS